MRWALALSSAVACNVYDSSLLTGGSESQGGSSAAGSSGGGTAGEGGTLGGTAGTSSGKGGSGNAGTGAAGTGGAQGGTAGTDTGGTSTGGTDTAGEGGEGPLGGTGGNAGSGGKGGSAGSTGGNAGSGVTGGNGGSGGGTCGPPTDCCPADDNKTQPGVCGCGTPDTDTDGDTVPNCNDTCAGFPDADCTALKGALVHRYSFGGSGTAATDTKGTAHGTISNATLAGAGALTLTGGNTAAPPYVNLPNGIVSSLTSATFEAWLTWNQSGTTGQAWQRIFDFGTSGTEDTQAAAASTTMSYLFLTCRGTTAPLLRVAFTTGGPTVETVVGAATALPIGTRQNVAVVIDDPNDVMTLYLNGVFQASAGFTGHLADIADVNNWLGRSQYASDYELIGVYDEFRIYNAALTAAQLRTSSMAGPDAAFLP